MHIHAASSFDPNDMTAMARWLVDVAGIVPVGYDVSLFFESMSQRSPSVTLILNAAHHVTVRRECESPWSVLWIRTDSILSQTLLGIDANHASGIPSPRYRITDFIPSDELRRKFATKLP